MSSKNSKNSIPRPRQKSAATRNSSISKVPQKKLRKSRNKTICKINPEPKSHGYHRRVVSDGAHLIPLQGNLLEKAPKVFNNQIFRDVYDEFGNHDRVLDTIESVHLYEEVCKGSLVTFNNKSDVSTEKFILPSASFKSFEETKDNFKDELIGKLEKLVKIGDENSFTRIMTIQRNKNRKFSRFSFPVKLEHN